MLVRSGDACPKLCGYSTVVILVEGGEASGREGRWERERKRGREGKREEEREGGRERERTRGRKGRRERGREGGREG